MTPIRSLGERVILWSARNLRGNTSSVSRSVSFFMPFKKYYVFDIFVSFFLANNCELYNHRPELDFGPTANRAAQGGSAKTCGSGDQNKTAAFYHPLSI